MKGSAPTKWGKKSKILPSKQGLANLGKSQRTVLDYSKEVPTLNDQEENPLLVNLMRKP